MEIEGAVYGSMGIAGSSVGSGSQGSAYDTNARISRERKAQDDIIDLTNRNGVWVEDMRAQGSASPRKVNGPGSVSESVAYDSQGKQVALPLNLKGKFVDVYA